MDSDLGAATTSEGQSQEAQPLLTESSAPEDGSQSRRWADLSEDDTWAEFGDGEDVLDWIANLPTNKKRNKNNDDNRALDSQDLAFTSLVSESGDAAASSRPLRSSPNKCDVQHFYYVLGFNDGLRGSEYFWDPESKSPNCVHDFTEDMLDGHKHGMRERRRMIDQGLLLPAELTESFDGHKEFGRHRKLKPEWTKLKHKKAKQDAITAKDALSKDDHVCVVPPWREVSHYERQIFRDQELVDLENSDATQAFERRGSDMPFSPWMHV